MEPRKEFIRLYEDTKREGFERPRLDAATRINSKMTQIRLPHYYLAIRTLRRLPPPASTAPPAPPFLPDLPNLHTLPHYPLLRFLVPLLPPHISSRRRLLPAQP
jgi:hypothetical protein